MIRNEYLTLCLVTHFTIDAFTEYQQFIQQVARSGLSSIQLRIKNCSKDEFIHCAKTIKSQINIPLIINDHVDVAVAVDADGVHLGQGDMTPAQARHLLGSNKIIGWSIETLEQLHQANQSTEIDYVGASAVFPSTTKLDCKTIWGIEGLKKLSQQSKHPVIAIGGINLTNIADVITSGASGAAVISAIHQHPNPAEITKKLRQRINQTQTENQHV